MRYSDIEEIVLNTWFNGLKENPDFGQEDLHKALDSLAHPSDVVQEIKNEADIIIEEYYETDRRDAELEAKYYPLPEYR